MGKTVNQIQRINGETMNTPTLKAWIFSRPSTFLLGWLLAVYLAVVFYTTFISGYGQLHRGQHKYLMEVPVSFAILFVGLFVLTAIVSYGLVKIASRLSPIGAWLASIALISGVVGFLGGLNLDRGVVFSLLGAVLVGAVGALFFAAPLLLERATRKT